MRLTASKVDLARRCLWPFRADAGPRNQGTFAADKGHDEHAHIEHTLMTGDTAPKSDTHRRWLAEWYALETNRDTGWTVERPIALDPETGETRLGPENWDRRDYAWAPWRFMVATPDAYSVRDGVVRVVDWKTGEQSGIESPSRAGQMLVLGLALARHFRCSAADLSFVLVNDRRLWAETERVSRLDLAIFEDELNSLVAATKTDVAPVRGPHCKAKFCDYLGRCPATREDLALAVPAPRVVPVLHSSEFVDAEHVGAQWSLVQAAEKRLSELRVAAIMWMREHRTPVPTPFGGVVEIETTERELVNETTVRVLRDLLGEAADPAIERSESTTKAKIESLAAAIAEPGETKKAAKDRLLTAMRERGAFKVSVSEVPKERPKAEGEAA